jgi:cyclic-di-GMP-binding protein
MDSALDFLRNWLPIGQRDDGTENARALRDWLDGMRDAPAEEVVASLAQRLSAMVAMQGNLHMRLKLLDAFDDIAQELLPALEHEIATVPLPFDARAQARAIAADNLLKALAAGYSNVATSIEMRKLAGGLGPLVQHALQRAIASLRRRQLLAYRAYATPSTTSWQQLHELYRTGARLNLLGPAKSGLPVAQLYVSTLLVAYADPGKFARTEIDALLDCAVRGAALIRIRHAGEIHEIRQGAPLFVIAPGETGPGKPLVRTRDSGKADCLYLDCSELAATVKSDIGAKARLDMPHEWLLPNASLDMLHTLSAMWGAQPTRRYSRMRFKPRADLVIGLLDVSLFLTGGAYRRRREDGSRRTPSSPAVSEWALIDESPDGFGIRYVRGEIGNVEVGDVVAIRPRESSRVQVCLVRRVSNAGQARFELGLQNLAPQAMVVELPASNGAGRAKAVLLPRMPAYGNAPGLLARPGSVEDGLELRCATGNETLNLRPLQRIEGNGNNEFHLLQATPAAH